MASATSMSNGTPPPDDREHDLATFLKPLIIDNSTVHKVTLELAKACTDLAVNSDQQFLPTPVTKLPTGQELGQFLAIDVGGTNLRVAFIELLGDATEATPPLNRNDKSRETIRNAQRPRIRRTLEKAWPIGEHLKKDKTEDLFSWIGDCIAEVVGDKLSNDLGRTPVPEAIDLGITFSFPMMQTKLSAATLMPTGKGFAISSDLDLGSTLLKGYERHTRGAGTTDSPPRSKRRRLGPLPPLRICAITNDTIATLASLAYSVKSLPNSRVVAGIVVGTGVNATIPMKCSSLGSAKTEVIKSYAPDAQETVVNTEITLSGTKPALTPITTKWDRELDATCARPGFQPLEYMTGGRYIGELIRLIFIDYLTNHHQPAISPTSLPVDIVEKYKFTTTLVSAVVARARTDTELVRELKQRLPPPATSDWTWTAHTAGALRRIASIVQIRSAAVIAASTVALLMTVGEIDLRDPASKAASPEKQEPADVEMGDASAPPKFAPNDTTKQAKSNQNLSHRSVFTSSAPNSPLLSAMNFKNPEELVIAYTGGIIQYYPNFKEQCQRFIDRLVMQAGPQEGGKSVLLREARDGGIIGAGVLCAMESLRASKALESVA